MSEQQLPPAVIASIVRDSFGGDVEAAAKALDLPVAEVQSAYGDNGGGCPTCNK